jgi:hypothetical protein
MRTCILLVLLAITPFSAVIGQSRSEISSRKIKTIYSESYDYRKSPASLKRTLTRYNRSGRPLEIIELDQDSVLLSREIFGYDARGNEILHETRDKNDSIRDKTTTVFDKWGNPLTRTEYERKERKYIHTSYKYNADNDKVEEIERDEAGRIIRTVHFLYDKRGMLIERTVKNDKGENLQKRIQKIQYP